RVLFITSGQELVMPGEPRNGAQIYNSNAYLFAGLLREYGFGQIGYMHVTDKASELDTEITRIFSASMEVDIIISTGGVSVGLFDS
ncbi:molybdopterin-binding protein, partial [Anaeroglobus sp. AF13-6AC]|uniref:molybdopterin-binding protein n=1 Tax=Anaeroglobus sp. AF13-6AC TaxID=2997918 RepID=UPI0022E8131C